MERLPKEIFKIVEQLLTLDAMRLTAPSIEKDDLKSGLSGKTNYSRP